MPIGCRTTTRCTGSAGGPLPSRPWRAKRAAAAVRRDRRRSDRRGLPVQDMAYELGRPVVPAGPPQRGHADRVFAEGEDPDERRPVSPPAQGAQPPTRRPAAHAASEHPEAEARRHSARPAHGRVGTHEEFEAIVSNAGKTNSDGRVRHVTESARRRVSASARAMFRRAGRPATRSFVACHRRT